MDGVKKKIPSEMKAILDKERVREGGEGRERGEVREGGRWGRPVRAGEASLISEHCIPVGSNDAWSASLQSNTRGALHTTTRLQSDLNMQPCHTHTRALLSGIQFCTDYFENERIYLVFLCVFYMLSIAF